MRQICSLQYKSNSFFSKFYLHRRLIIGYILLFRIPSMFPLKQQKIFIIA